MLIARYVLFPEIIARTIFPTILWLAVIIFPKCYPFCLFNKIYSGTGGLHFSLRFHPGYLRQHGVRLPSQQRRFLWLVSRMWPALPYGVIILPSDPEGNICEMNIARDCYKYEVAFCTVSHFGCCWSQSIKFSKEIASVPDVFNCWNWDYISSG